MNDHFEKEMKKKKRQEEQEDRFSRSNLLTLALKEAEESEQQEQPSGAQEIPFTGHGADLVISQRAKTRGGGGRTGKRGVLKLDAL